MARQKLKLYVWQGSGVLQDYGTGMIVAVARTLPGAKSAARIAYGFRNSDLLESSLLQTPEVITLDEDTKLQAWCVAGGS